MLAAHVVVLHHDEALGIVVAAELDVAPLDCHEFSAAQAGAHCHQEQGIIGRANLLGSLQELLNLHSGQRDAFALGCLCGARETAQTGRWVRLDKPFLDGVIEQAADNA